MRRTDTMGESIYPGVRKGAFANKLKTLEYHANVTGEMVTEVWYRLDLEDAKRFIEHHEHTERKIEQGNQLAGSWIKLITTEYLNTATGKTRRHWSTLLRPYVQGYGCDGTTDLNFHTISNKLAEKHGLDYRSLLARAYPDQFSLTDDFSWLEDDVVIAETTIPQEIDPDLALMDLEQINNYTLAIEFGIELYRLGVTSTNWEQIRKELEVMKKKIHQGLDEWFRMEGT